MTPEKPASETADHEKPQPQPPPSDPGTETDAGTPEEIGGPQGAEPTRFGDWERNGRCSDF